jgi:hypothetical protein
MNKFLRTLLLGIIFAGLLAYGRFGAAQTLRPLSVWKQKQDFITTLQAPGSGTWKQVSLKEVIADLASVHRVFLLLDRRIDLDQQLDYTPPKGSLEVTLRGIAAHMKLGIAIGDGWVYFGPPDAAKKLRTLIALREAEAEAKFSKPELTPWTRRAPFVWAKPKTPRDIVTEQLDKVTKLANPEAIVNDLWAANNWPPLSLYERLSLCLVQFDLTWQWQDDGLGIKLVPLPTEVVIAKQYTVADPVQFTAKLKEFEITSKIEIAGKVVKVTGLAEDQQIAADLAAGKKAHKVVVKQDSQRFTLKANQPVGKLLRAFAAQLELTLEVDEQALQKANISLEREIQLDVLTVTREELFKKVCDPAGLAFEFQEKKIMIKPAK